MDIADERKIISDEDLLTVFARYLNVSTKLVKAWEANRRTPDGPALVLLQIAARQPHLIESVRQGTATGRPRPSRRRLERSPGVAGQFWRWQFGVQFPGISKDADVVERIS